MDCGLLSVPYLYHMPTITQTDRSTMIAHPDKDPVSYLFQAPSTPVAAISLGHGAGAGMEHAHMESLAMMLLDLGMAVFRYQFPFRERGGGRDSLKVSLSTVQNAAEKAASYFPDLPLMAGGHSFGGRMTTTAASEGLLPDVKKLILFSYPLHAPGKPGIDRAAHLAAIQQPMLFLSGDRDTFVKPELWGPVVNDLGDHAQLTWLKGADHGWKTRKRDTEAVADVYAFASEQIQKWR